MGACSCAAFSPPLQGQSTPLFACPVYHRRLSRPPARARSPTSPSRSASSARAWVGWQRPTRCTRATWSVRRRSPRPRPPTLSVTFRRAPPLMRTRARTGWTTASLLSTISPSSRPIRASVAIATRLTSRQQSPRAPTRATLGTRTIRPWLRTTSYARSSVSTSWRWMGLCSSTFRSTRPASARSRRTRPKPSMASATDSTV
mmetsp:Transcript_59274/g.163690  ORF Transcript_59274/g.163690 Transcript_59274/m.163690 type:complete len:202 (-) Transcript_59274:1202-1807(-)